MGRYQKDQDYQEEDARVRVSHRMGLTGLLEDLNDLCSSDNFKKIAKPKLWELINKYTPCREKHNEDDLGLNESKLRSYYEQNFNVPKKDPKEY